MSWKSAGGVIALFILGCMGPCGAPEGGVEEGLPPDDVREHLDRALEAPSEPVVPAVPVDEAAPRGPGWKDAMRSPDGSSVVLHHPGLSRGAAIAMAQEVSQDLPCAEALKQDDRDGIASFGCRVHDGRRLFLTVREAPGGGVLWGVARVGREHLVGEDPR